MMAKSSTQMGNFSLLLFIVLSELLIICAAHSESKNTNDQIESESIPVKWNFSIYSGNTETLLHKTIGSQANKTEIERYKAKLYLSIAPRWRLSLDRELLGPLMTVGRVEIKFFVQANGIIRNLTVLKVEPNTESTRKLESISLDAIRRSSPVEPFTSIMKDQFGEGFWDTATFTINDKSNTTSNARPILGRKSN